MILTRKIITEPKEYISSFVTEMINESPGWGDHEAIGLVDESGIIAGVVYNRFSAKDGKFNDCDMNVAALPGKRWASREFLKCVFYYPFVQLGCRRVNALIGANNTNSIRLVEHLGFTKDATIPRGFPDQDMIIYGLFPEHCRYI